MGSIDWKRKLTSRKLWAAVASFVSMLIVALGFAEETATQVAALIMAGASVVAYVIGEGLADSSGMALDAGAGETPAATETAIGARALTIDVKGEVSLK